MRTELVTTLKRKATDLISQLTIDQEPVLITQHGLPAAYLINVQMYEDMQSRLALLEGIGKPEPLRQGLSGYWSRRITEEHRLVYRPIESGILLVQLRYHYKK